MELREIIKTLPDYDPYITAEDCLFDEVKATKAIDFIETFCSLSKSCISGDMGKPFKLEIFQKAIISNLFGWVRPDGTLRYREALLYMPRGNGKSELASAIVLYVGYCMNEGGGELYTCAGDSKQARIIFDAAATMIRRNPSLSRITADKIRQFSIEFPKNTFFKYLSSSAETKHGYSVSLAILDELHVFPGRNLVDTMASSRRSRKQPILIYTTTASWAGENICNEIHKRAKQCQAARMPEDVGYNPYFLPVVYEAASTDDWTDINVIKRCNPNYGVSVSATYLNEELQKAKDTPSMANNFRRLHCNQQTESSTAWLSSQDWKSCAGTPFEVSILDGEECYGGLDLSTILDLTAFVLYFPKHKVFLCWFFVPEKNMAKRERLDKVPYATWSDIKGPTGDTYIIPTPGDVVDYDFVEAKIVELATRYRIKEIAYDTWNCTQTAIRLQGHGITMWEHRQGYMSMNEPSKEFERLIRKHEIRHLNNPVLNWMAANVTIEVNPEGSIKASKATSTERIDGIISCIMALSRYILSERASDPTIYRL